MSKIADKVYDIAQPIVKAEGLKLIDVEYLKEGSDWKLKIFIENPDGNLNLGHCENVSRIISQKLDSLDPIKGSYVLEVSSPGLDRPLKSKEDFENNIGEKIFVKTYAPYQGEKEFEGELVNIDEDQVILKSDQDKGVIEIPFSKIANSRLTIDF